MSEIKNQQFNVITGDLMLMDRVLSLDTNDANLMALVNKYNTDHPDGTICPGSKTKLTKDEFEKFRAYADAHQSKDSPGGSSANTLSTLKKLNPQISADFFGVIGTEPHANQILYSFKADGINVVPKNHQREDVMTPVSIVLVDENGKRSILTYRGNGLDKVKEVIPNPAALLRDDHNVLFLQGSMWQKFGKDFANAFTHKRWENWKERKIPQQLWIALPTHTEFGDKNDAAEQERNLFNYIIPSANVVMSNMDELQRLCADKLKGLPKEIHKQRALELLQEQFRKRELLQAGFPEIRKQVAFITDDKNGAYIVTVSDEIGKNGIIPVPAMELNGERIVNTLGAGDTSFAGFLHGYTNGLSFEDSARVAMVLAAEKIKVMPARLPDPDSALRVAFAKYPQANDLLQKLYPDAMHLSKFASSPSSIELPPR